MQRPIPQPCSPSKLSESILERLSAYAFAATAAGVGVLASVNPSEAKVVYTPVNTQILGFVPLDLNSDGVTDFFLIKSGRTNGHSDSGWLSASPLNTNNRVLGQGTVQFFRQNPTVAFSVPAGFEIGPRTKGFHPPGKKLMAGYWFAFSTGTFFSQGFAGPWANGGKGVNDRYLGLAFQINGLVHFGWARLTVGAGGALPATLTGYAYETTPNKPIKTGKTHSDDEAPEASLTAPELGMLMQAPAPILGVLALGADGIAIWRRESEDEASLSESTIGG